MRCKKALNIFSLLFAWSSINARPLSAQAPSPTPNPTAKSSSKESSSLEVLPENISKKIDSAEVLKTSPDETSKASSLLLQLSNQTAWLNFSNIGNKDKDSCINLNQLDRNKDSKLLNELKTFQNEFTQILKKNDIRTLSKLFHPKLNIDFKKIEEMNVIIRQSIGKSFDYSVYKTWLIHNPSMTGNSIPCEEDNFLVHKQLGYSAQISYWVQISGDKDIGRIFISWILDKDKKLRIGSWHYQRWTHNNLDPEAWLKKGEEFRKENNSLMAILAFDLSLKLLDYRHFLKIKLSNDVNTLLSSSGGMKRFQDSVLKLIPNDSVFRTKSLLAPEGLGFQLDFQFKQELSLNDRSNLCKNALKKILSDKDLGLSAVDGARCSYYFPKDNIDGESRTGGRYFKKSEIM